jgi:hypothetical protein
VACSRSTPVTSRPNDEKYFAFALEGRGSGWVLRVVVMDMVSEEEGGEGK